MKKKRRGLGVFSGLFRMASGIENAGGWVFGEFKMMEEQMEIVLRKIENLIPYAKKHKKA